MRANWLCLIAVALVTLAPAAVFGDYLTQTFALVPPGEQSQGGAFPGGRGPGTVQVEAYNGIGPSGGGLNAGEVRLTFTPSFADAGTVVPGLLTGSGGIQAVAFNTDLSLQADQIQVSGGWVKTPNFTNSSALGNGGSPPGFFFGKFNWAAGAATIAPNGSVTVLISELGTNATISHFVFGSARTQNPAPGAMFESALFAENQVEVLFGSNGDSVTSNWLATNADGASASGAEPSLSPEPASLSLASLGLAGLLGRQLLRRRRQATDRLSSTYASTPATTV